MYFAVGDAQSHHDVGSCVRTGEHVLDLEAGINIPLRDIGGPHGLLHLRGQTLALSDRLHGLEGQGLVHALGDQIGHDIVAGADGSGKDSLALLDQGLGVAQPHIRAVGEAGNADQFRHGGGPGVIEHADDELGSKLRDPQ